METVPDEEGVVLESAFELGLAIPIATQQHTLSLIVQMHQNKAGCKYSNNTITHTSPFEGRTQGEKCPTCPLCREQIALVAKHVGSKRHSGYHQPVPAGELLVILFYED